MALPMLLSRYLVPDSRPAAPDGFTLIDQKITGGLPATIPLDSDTRLVVHVPTGLAAAWRDAEPTDVVSNSDPELAPFDGTASRAMGDASRPAARLMVVRAGSAEGSLALTVGTRRLAPDTGDAPGVHIEVIVLAWQICAGSLRGSGDYGSRMTLGWRRADAAVDQFGVLPINPHVLRRLLLRQIPLDLSPEIRRRLRPIESELGRGFVLQNRAFQINVASRQVIR